MPSTKESNMRTASSSRSWLNLFIFITCYAWLITPTSATNHLESKSLDTCMPHSAFSASYFNVLFTPNNGSIFISIKGSSGISGKVLLKAEVIAYGYPAFQKTIDPCDGKMLLGFCPMTPAPFELPFNADLPKDQIKRIPNPIYYIPDLDAKVRIRVTSVGHDPLACVEAVLSNGRTVHQVAVAWIVAATAFIGLSVSALASGLDHSNAAAHLLSNSLSLFSYSQQLAFIGMTSVSTSPIVRAWTQNFQWSMGIMDLDFLQRMATWYQRATGGSPSTLLPRLNSVSVRVEKRSLGSHTNAHGMHSEIHKSIVVNGIQRVGFQARIEKSNIFFTAYNFFVIFILLTIALTGLAKLICHGFVRYGVVRHNKFVGIRKAWKLVLKGNLFLILLIAFPPMVTMCLWELTTRDSAAELTLAICTLVTLLALVLWSGIRIYRLVQRSWDLHTNPAYVLYSNHEVLQHWGVFYIPFRAPMYFWGFILLGFAFAKSCFVAFSQSSGTTHAVSFLVLDSIQLVILSIIRPYMDKKTNAFNISIASVGLANSIMLVLFARDLGLPPLGISITGVLFFAINVLFLLVMLILVMVNVAWALFSSNPDKRYGAVRDDRNSFIPSKASLPNPELEDLGSATRSTNVPEVPRVPSMGVDGQDEREFRVEQMESDASMELIASHIDDGDDRTTPNGKSSYKPNSTPAERHDKIT